MKKNSTLLLCMCFFSLSTLHAQLTVNMSPNLAIPGQTLTTSITTPNNIFIWGSPYINDIWLQHSSNYTIYPNFGGYNYISSGEIEEEWTIPSNAPLGFYDLNFWYLDPFPFPNTVLATIPNAFLVGEYAISGTVFFDEDSNGLMNGNDYPLANKAVELTPGGITQYTNSSGQFIFGVLAGNYTVKYLPASDWVATTIDSINVSVTNASITGLEFGTQALNEYADYSFSIFSYFPICLTNVKYFVTTINTGTVTLATGTVKFVRPSNTGLVSANPVPNLVSGDTLIWFYTNLNIGEMMKDTITLLMPTAGNNLSSSASVSGQNSSGTISGSDQATHSQVVFCSYDPNDKAVNPPGEYALHYTLMTDTLEYLIRFQNTGNFPATNIYIEDTLSQWLDISSFEFLGSSHQVSVSTDGNGAFLFEFDNINLPDSNSNEPGSHGYIAFRVKPLNGLPNNTVVNNTAFIYFDLNAPVATNTTFNTLVNSIPLSIENWSGGEFTANIFPNPFSDYATLVFPNPGHNAFELEIYDLLGNVVQRKILFGDRFLINGDELLTGIYLYKLKSADESRNFYGKFVIGDTGK